MSWESMVDAPAKRLCDIPLDALLYYLRDGASRDALAASSHVFNECRVNSQARKEQFGQTSELRGRLCRALKQSWTDSALTSLRCVARSRHEGIQRRLSSKALASDAGGSLLVVSVSPAVGHTDVSAIRMSRRWARRFRPTPHSSASSTPHTAPFRECRVFFVFLSVHQL